MATEKSKVPGAAQLRPFQNESNAIAIGELTIENRADQVEIYGSLSITRDQAGLAAARGLKELVDAVVAALVTEDLPERIVEKPATRVKNPFSG